MKDFTFISIQFHVTDPAHCSSPLKSFWYLLTLKSWFHCISYFLKLCVICSFDQHFFYLCIQVTLSNEKEKRTSDRAIWQVTRQIPSPSHQHTLRRGFQANYKSPKLYCHLVCISPSCPQEFPERPCQMPWLINTFWVSDVRSCQL